MKFKDESVSSITDLLTVLKKQRPSDQPVWFRGQSDFKWKLVPSVARFASAVNAEFTLIKRFKQNALTFLTKRPTTEWDWLFLMQHYGVPTRLLDWTESPLVAVYFAVSEEEYRDKDGVIWCLLPKSLNENANYQPEHSLELPFFDVDEQLKLYLPDAIAKERNTKLKPLAAIAVRESPRMVAQLGAFTITHREQTPIDDVGDGSHIWRLRIPKVAKKDLLDELALFSVNRLSLFPELTSVAESAREVI